MEELRMACLFGHKWSGCKCEKCGKTRDEQHDWNGCRCTICGKTQDEGHKYVRTDGCKAVCSLCGRMTGSVYHNWVDGKCSDCGKPREIDTQNRTGSATRPSDAQSQQKAEWTPTNPRLASNMPLSSLLRVFIFTNGDGKTVLSCPVTMGTLSDTAGIAASEIAGKVPVDIIARSNVAIQCIQTSQFPVEGWMAMYNIDASVTQKAQMGEYKTVVRPVTNPNTRESSCCILIYQNPVKSQQPVKGSSTSVKPTESNREFAIVIEDVISIQGRGTYIKGIVTGASVSRGDPAYIISNKGNVKETKINDIRDDAESSAGIRNEANIGDVVALLLQGIATSDVEKGDVLSAKAIPNAQTVSKQYEPNKETTFFMVVEDIFSLKPSNTTSVIGSVQGEDIQCCDKVYIIKNSGKIIETVIQAIDDIEHGEVSKAEVGKTVDIRLSDTSVDDIDTGDIISATEKLSDQAKNAAKNTPFIVFYYLASDLAHLSSINEAEIERIESELLAGGDEAIGAVYVYLRHCGQGKHGDQSWDNAERLVRLISKFSSDLNARRLNQLIAYPSDIDGYKTHIINVAKKELMDQGQPGDDAKRDEEPPSVAESFDMTPLEKFKGMEQAEKESYIKEMNGIDLIDLMQDAREIKVSSNDVALLCRWMKVRMNSAHEYRQDNVLEKAMSVLSCGNKNHFRNYQAEMAKGFLHPDIADRAFTQLINDYKPLIEDYKS